MRHFMRANDLAPALTPCIIQGIKGLTSYLTAQRGTKRLMVRSVGRGGLLHCAAPLIENLSFFANGYLLPCYGEVFEGYEGYWPDSLIVLVISGSLSLVWALILSVYI